MRGWAYPPSTLSVLLDARGSQNRIPPSSLESSFVMRPRRAFTGKCPLSIIPVVRIVECVDGAVITRSACVSKREKEGGKQHP